MNTITPNTIEEVADILISASAERQPVAPIGAGLHQHLAGPIPDSAVRLSTLALDRLIEHSPADLIVRVEAGMRLADLQQTLGEHGQWLPWDPPAGANATIGGLLAAARSGPLRLGYGTPRDWLLGSQVVLGDGRLVKSGGKVVKNVAGYDSHKLHIGALGTLGIMVTATFKVAPKPEADAALLGYFDTMVDALAAAEQLRQRPLSPVSLAVVSQAALPYILPESVTHGVALVARSLGLMASVARHRAAAHSLGLTEDMHPSSLWQRLTEWVTSSEVPELVLRVGVRPVALGAALVLIEHHAPPGSAVIGYPGVGLVYARWPIGTDFSTRLAALRMALQPHDGYLVIEACPHESRSGLDVWGPAPSTLPVMQRLKRQWDPAGILNPNRYLVS